MPIREPRVFTIPPGAPFLPTLARALLDGRLLDGFPGPGGPLALADATIYVPTQRAGAALAQALLRASGGQSVLLPRIAPLGAFEPDDATAFYSPDDDEAPRPGPPAAVGELTRRHALAKLVRAWGKALRGAIRSVGADGRLVCDASEPALVAATPAQAYALAGDLAALIDDMIIEGVDWRRIERLAPEAYDSYWRITVDFLKIAFAHWPRWLEEQGLIDRAKRSLAARRGRDRRPGKQDAPRPDRHRGLDRRESRHRRPHRRHRPQREGRRRPARPRPKSRWSRLGNDRRPRPGRRTTRHPPAGAHASADRPDRRQAGRGRHARRAATAARRARCLPERSASPCRGDRRLARAQGGPVRRLPSRRRSPTSRSSPPTARRRRLWRSPWRCAKSWRRPARPRR